MLTFLIVLVLLLAPFAVLGLIVVLTCMDNELSKQYIMTCIHVYLRSKRNA